MSKKVFINYSVEELKSELKSLAESLFHLRIRKSLGDKVLSHKFGHLKKDVARIKTELSRRGKINA